MCATAGCAAKVRRASGCGAEYEGLGGQVSIVRSDGRRHDLSDATVVFVFLPVAVAASLVDGLLARMPRGSRLVVHEQQGLPPSLTPDASLAVLADGAVTVAHRWEAGGRA